MTAIFALAMAGVGLIEASAAPLRHCQQVRAKYEIYADGDALWVVGSKHRLNVVIDPLDKELRARGWTSTVAYGDFTVCSKRPVPARALTRTDAVLVSGYSGVRYVRR